MSDRSRIADATTTPATQEIETYSDSELSISCIPYNFRHMRAHRSPPLLTGLC
jgi:hypothetical protein